MFHFNISAWWVIVANCEFPKEQDGHEDLDEEDDDDDEWNPVCQGAAVENEDGPAEEAEEDDADEEATGMQKNAWHHVKLYVAIVFAHVFIPK